MAGPLEGFKIVDLTAMITGPLATMMLADQGAEVVKVEPPGFGDIMRYLSTQRGGMSTFFALCNRSKRSIVVNLREERGREIVRELVRGADVFVQNFRPGVAERLGLGEPVLRADHPELVYVSISAFGHEGPYAGKPAYDHIIQGLSGMPYVQDNGETNSPVYVRNAVCDKMTAYTVAQGITSALLARERGRGGQHLRVSMLDASLAFLWPDGMTNHTLLQQDGVVELPPIAASYRFIETTDGFISAAAVTDAQWAGLFRVAGRPELAEDPRFASTAARMQNLDALLAEMGEAGLEMSSAEAIAALEAEDVPCGPILSIDEIPGNEQVVANRTLVESQHPQLGRMREPRPPIRFSTTPAEIRRPAPALGQHTDEVMGELRLAAAEIADLRGKGVLG